MAASIRVEFTPEFKRNLRALARKSLSTNPKFLALIERSRAQIASQGGISSNEMRRRLRIPRTSE